VTLPGSKSCSHLKYDLKIDLTFSRLGAYFRPRGYHFRFWHFFDPAWQSKGYLSVALHTQKRLHFKMKSFAGGENLKFYDFVPGHVDIKKAPGFSELPEPKPAAFVFNLVTLKSLFMSGNLLWALISLAFYFMFPYDLSPHGTAAKFGPLSIEFVQERFPLWLIVTFGWIFWWYISLVSWGWGVRPYIMNRTVSWRKIIHNVVYNISGVLIWTGFENVFAYLWATNRLPYMADAEAFSTRAGQLRFALGLILTPCWREVHFYFAHRLLHYKPMFRQVHSLHHRNTDVEPFSGLCMHPVEHFYYFTSMLPSVYLYLSPFHLLFNGIHLLLSPAAAHAGYEGSFQSDSFHYMHHRYFECNYGTPGVGFLDVYFGTYMNKFIEKDDVANGRDDAKADLSIAPTKEFLLYLFLSVMCVQTWLITVLHQKELLLDGFNTFVVSAICGFGPQVVAIAMALSAGQSILEPFHKKPFFDFAFHQIIGNLFCAVPITSLCYKCLWPQN
jgi:sterol desaturase/sphingolipid hydroxylase (fatty acid hydroxylase superfamily)